MLVVAKTPPIRVEVFGEGMAELAAVLKKAIPGVSITPEPDFEDDEFVKPEDIPWFREIKSNWHPGETIRIRRENSGMTQAELAEKSHIPFTNISAIENGKRSVGSRTAKKLAAALGIDYRELL
jgi:DNA-binding XRE family transcriptional regulator